MDGSFNPFNSNPGRLPPPRDDEETRRVFQVVKEAWYSNRAIVPVVGAGLSADAGIPIIRSVVRYFGKFRQFLFHRAYLPPILPIQADHGTSGHSQKRTPSPYDGGDSLHMLRDYYLAQPWQYVAHFGWPDRFQLNEDLQHNLDCVDRSQGKVEKKLTNEVCEGLNGVLERINPGGYWNYRKLVLKLVGADLARDLFTDFDAAPALENDKVIIADKDVARTVINRLKMDESYDSVPFNVAGDWKRLLQYFTNYQGDYADALFSRLCAGRSPSQGHSYLSFLVKLLGIRTILTFNFDELIEHSLWAEGVQPLVFAMEEGRGLPHETLVRDVVSVIKLHGNNHTLLVDERLDHPLPLTYKHRFDDLVGINPLLLVIGCSGEDQRLRDLVEHVLRRSNQSPAAANLTRVAWFHFEATPPSFLTKYPGAITAQINSPGATLMHCYSALTGRHPASKTPYLAHSERPIRVGKAEDQGESSSSADLSGSGLATEYSIDGDDGLRRLYKPDYKIAVISTWNKADCDNWTVAEYKPEQYPTDSASQALVDAANFWLNKGYHTIWVDLESVHTLAGVVGSILDQCRLYDVSLAPSVLPSGELTESERSGDERIPTMPTIIHAAVRRVAHALKRTRYFVALDGLETYLWPPLTHHGETRAGEVGATTRLTSLMNFFGELTDVSFGNSMMCIGIDPPKKRSPDEKPPPHLKELIDYVGNIHRLHKSGYIAIKLSSDPRAFIQTFKFGVPLRSFPTVGFEKANEVAATREEAEYPLVRLTEESLESLRSQKPADFLGNVPFPLHSFLSIVLLYLSCCRRTRHLTLLRHVLRPFLGDSASPDSIESLLCWLTSCKGLGLRRLEGANFWFDRTTRDFIYDRNSRHASSAKAMSECKALNPEQLRNSIPQLFLLVTTHQQVARTHYSRTFIQSQDTFVFLEYTYHSASSIRYLAKLLAILTEALDGSHNGKKEEAAHEILNGFRQCGALLRGTVREQADELSPRTEATSAYDEVLRQTQVHGSDSDEPTQPGSTSSGGDLWRVLHQEQVVGGASLEPRCLAENAKYLAGIRKELKDRHTRELSSLHRSWVRSEGVLRTQVPAQQLLHWCHYLLNDDLKQRFNNVVVGHTESRDLPWTQAVTGINEDARDLCDAFGDFIRDLRVKLWIERSEYLECLRSRHRQLAGEHLVEEFAEHPDAYANAWRANFYLPDEKHTEKVTFTHLHWLLDISVCFIKHFQSRHRPTDEQPQPDHHEAIRLLDGIERRLKYLAHRAKSANRFPSIVDQSDHYEATLRLAHLRIEIALRTISIFSTGFDGSLTDRSYDSRPSIGLDALERAETALTAVRSQDRHSNGPPRSVVIDPTPDGSLYLPYRSVFFTLRARAIWQICAARGMDRNQRTDVIYEEFDSAFRNFELARGGLESGNTLLASVNEIYAVEACLAWSRIRLYCPPGPAVDDADDRLSQAAAKHELARFSLQRAERYLVASRRNVIWWRFFYLMVAQYHADRLLLGFARLAHAFPTLYSEKREVFQSRIAKDVAPHLTRLRRGYNSLRDALDYQLPRHGALQSAWLLRIWCEITLAAFGIGHLLLNLAQHHRPGESADRAAQLQSNSLYLWDYLVWLNQRERLAAEEEQRSVVREDKPHDHSSKPATSMSDSPSTSWTAEGYDGFDFALRVWNPATDVSKAAFNAPMRLVVDSDAAMPGINQPEISPLTTVAEAIFRYCASVVSGGNSQSPLALREMLIQQAKIAEFVCVWSFAKPIARIKNGMILRIEVEKPALIHWNSGPDKSVGWQDLLTHHAGNNIHAADLPTNRLEAGTSVQFTFLWRSPEGGRWYHDFEPSGRSDFVVTVT